MTLIDMFVAELSNGLNDMQKVSFKLWAESKTAEAKELTEIIEELAKLSSRLEKLSKDFG